MLLGAWLHVPRHRAERRPANPPAELEPLAARVAQRHAEVMQRTRMASKRTLRAQQRAAACAKPDTRAPAAQLLRQLAAAVVSNLHRDVRGGGCHAAG